MDAQVEGRRMAAARGRRVERGRRTKTSGAGSTSWRAGTASISRTFAAIRATPRTNVATAWPSRRISSFFDATEGCETKMDHDQRFKNLLQTFFREFLLLFFHRWAERLDATAVEWLDKEIFPDPPEGQRRILDLSPSYPPGRR